MESISVMKAVVRGVPRWDCASKVINRLRKSGEGLCVMVVLEVDMTGVTAASLPRGCSGVVTASVSKSWRV